MDVYQGDPFQRPYWRHERVLQLRQFSQRCTRRDDRWIQEYKTFLIEWDKGAAARERLRHTCTGLFYAHMIHTKRVTEPEVAFLTEARLLSASSYAEIAYNLKTFPAVIEWYEKLYFNVSKRLQHHDWIVKSILLPAYDQYVEQEVKEETEGKKTPAAQVVRTIVQPHLDLSLKFFSYFGGPLVCDIMITGFRRHQHVRSSEALADYFNQQFATRIQQRSIQAAMTFEVNKYNVMELFATHTRLLEIHRYGKGDDERKTEFETNVNALMSELPWSTGRSGAQLYEGQALGQYDMSAAEVSAEEAVESGLGSTVLEMDELKGRDIFEERQKGQRHAITK